MTTPLAESTKVIPMRKIGSTEVTALGYGAMAIGTTFYGKPDSDEERFKVLDRLYEMGCTFWDTASMYGDSEELIGKWFARTGLRSKIFLATKFGFYTRPDGKGGLRGDPEFIKEEVVKSLAKLQTDYIDLYYQHRMDKNVPAEISVGAMKELVEEGKVRYLGLSEASPDTIRRAHKVHPISAIQVEYNPWELDLEKPGGVLSVARELGIAIVAYSPTGRGIVTGRWRSFDDLPEDDWRRGVPKFKPENWPRINKLVDSFKELANKYEATPAQVALAWLLKQGDDVIPIPGSKQIPYVEENWASLELLDKISEEDLKVIRVLADEINSDLRGDARYPHASMGTLYAETLPLSQWKL
ncbi:Aldo/keto reductase [Clavulina sp. PMI_390]|nr:Aldo/keto reductase [Clavulina sp. PMI_390]